MSHFNDCFELGGLAKAKADGRLHPDIAKLICEVQPMTDASGAIFSIKPNWEWTLPRLAGNVHKEDDVTVLLIMGYKLDHGHNCCSGFNGIRGAPMPFWIPPGEVYYYHKEACDHDWDVNFRG